MSREGLQLIHSRSPEISSLWMVRLNQTRGLIPLRCSREPESPVQGFWTISDAQVPVNMASRESPGPILLGSCHSDTTPEALGLDMKSPT